MPCDSVRKPNQTLESRGEEITKSLGRLEAALTSGSIKVKIAPNGAVAFEGWKPEERDGVTDVCAYRTLAAQGSFALRQAVAPASDFGRVARSTRTRWPRATTATMAARPGTEGTEVSGSPPPNWGAIVAITEAAERSEADKLRAFWSIAHALVYAAGKFRVPSAEIESVVTLVEGGVLAQRAKEN